MIPLLVWLAGYSRRQVALDQEKGEDSFHQLSLSGGALTGAAFVEMLSWGAAFYWWTERWGQSSQQLAGATGAAIGLGIVLLLDRPAIYAMDKRPPGGPSLAPYVLLRLFMLTILACTSVKLMLPSLQHHALAGEAIRMQEQSDGRRESRYQASYRLPEARAEVREARRERQSREAALAAVPAEITAGLAAARACWAEVRRTYGQGRAPNRAVAAARARARAGCARQQVDANRALARHRAEAGAALAEARAAERDAGETLVRDSGEMRERLARLRAREEDAIVPDSTTVQWSLLVNAPGALIEMLALLISILILQTLPFSTKLLLGQSKMGRRLGEADAIEAEESRERLADAQSAARRAAVIRRLNEDALGEAAASPSTRTELAQEMAAHSRRAAPFEAVSAVYAVAEREKRAMDAISRREPALRTLGQRLWADALRSALRT